MVVVVEVVSTPVLASLLMLLLLFLFRVTVSLPEAVFLWEFVL